MGPTGAVEDLDTITSSEWSIPLSLAEFKDKLEQISASMKTTHALFQELRTKLDTAPKAGAVGKELDRKQLSVVRTELSMRFSLAFSCITFCLIAIPLGITAQRRETTVGFILSLGVALLYFFFIMLANSMNERAGNHPHLLMWLPNVLFLGIGGWLFYKLSKR